MQSILGGNKSSIKEKQMNKEEVLRRSRNTFKESDPYESYLINAGYLIGCLVAIIVSGAIFFLQRLIQGEWNYALYAAFTLILAVKNAYVGIKLRKKKDIIKTIVFGIVSIVFIVAHLLSFCGI